MGINLNFTGVETNSFDPIPKGTYHATIFEVQNQETKKGDPMLVFQFKIVEEKQNNRRAFLNHVIKPTTLWSLKNTLLAAGLSEEELDGELDLDLDDLCGRMVRIVIGHETYEGEVRDRVKRVLAPKPGFVAADDDSADKPKFDDEPSFEDDGEPQFEDDVADLSDTELPFDMDDEDDK